MFKNIYFYFKKIKSVLPEKLKRKLFFLYFSLLIAAIFEMISLGTIPIFISFLVDMSSSYEIFGFDPRQFFETFFPTFDVLFIFPFLIIFLYLVKNLYLLFVIYLEQKIIKELKIYFIQNIYEIYLKKPYSFFLKKNSSELMRNIVTESQTATSMVANILQFSREFSVLIVITFLLFFFEPVITFFSIFSLSAIGLIFYNIFNKFLRQQGVIRLKFLGKLINDVNIMIGAIKDIKIYFKEKFFLDKFKHNTSTYEDVIFKVGLVGKTPRIIFEFVSVLVLFCVFFIFLMFQRDVLSILPIIGLMTISIVRLMPAFSTMSSCVYFIKYCKKSFDRITEELLSRKKIDNILNKNYLQTKKTNENSLNVTNLKFSYLANERTVPIKDLNLKINSGDMIGIIGKSGTGKSTLVNLILGLLNPSEGKIELNHKEDKISKNLFSYVPQEIFLINGTLKENIIFGEEDDNNDRFISEIVESAGLNELVEKNKKGFDLIVGERGIRLSGGEKQRVGIARALYKKAKILILDEATSSLDVVTEKQIMDSINKLKNKLTIIIVTHRHTTIKNCDKVFLLKEGKVLDSGNLEELRKKFPQDFVN